MANPQTHISPVWPASGACIAALYSLGLRLWPAILGGALVASAWTPGLGWEIVPFSACNCLEAVVGAAVLQCVYKKVVPKSNSLRGGHRSGYHGSGGSSGECIVRCFDAEVRSGLWKPRVLDKRPFLVGG